ncbi:uncharacterized protein LOC115237307 [Formica exsecta]|uniref:uncharacterized protein LOC115237307 n=1 Tax=Formica exsecta TaxID=72781 RepID=UPI0011430A75|nr:uncharacterized protein LOC115237307 [Formica exsecta]
MRTFKNVKKKINWNTWPTKNRETEIYKTIEELAPPWVPSKITEELISISQRSTDKWNSINKEFNMVEFDRAINMIKRDSAPGRDGIDYVMLKKLPLAVKQVLINIYNEIWKYGQLPMDWFKYQVIFIDKIGKEKVRPIALSSCVGKVMERMVNERLIWWAEKKKILHHLQNGFRRGRSCAENLVKIVADIRSYIYNNEYTSVAFLDVTSAYDIAKCLLQIIVSKKATNLV